MLLTVQAFSGIFLFLLGRGPWRTVRLWAEWFLMLGLMLTSRDHSQANPTNLLQRPGDSVIPRPTGLQSPSITLPKSVTLMTRVETFPMSHSKEILNFIIKCVPKHRDCQQQTGQDSTRTTSSVFFLLIPAIMAGIAHNPARILIPPLITESPKQKLFSIQNYAYRYLQGKIKANKWNGWQYLSTCTVAKVVFNCTHCNNLGRLFSFFFHT